MAFLIGSTLVKEPVLQAVIVLVWPQMFKSDVTPKQTNITTQHIVTPVLNNPITVLFTFIVAICILDDSLLLSLMKGLVGSKKLIPSKLQFL